MTKYIVSAFTDETAKDLLWPENTWDAETVEEVAVMIHNCTRRMAGIRVVKILINEPDDREAVDIDPIVCPKCGKTEWSGGTDAKPRPWCNHCGTDQPNRS